jgi:XRE family transcriptional regulator, regulator of sulfur utilization
MPSKKSPANQALGNAMRTIRRQRGYSQEDFAPRAGIERSNYGAIERGEFNVTLDTIAKIAAGLGMTVVELLHRAKL